MTYRAALDNLTAKTSNESHKHKQNVCLGVQTTRTLKTDFDILRFFFENERHDEN